ncbi:Acetyltransferase (GNAT) family protein [Virgibacillus subterraneus]|uniref:Acetyltransferase (GNAT) family protein n=1 Tax=Virgibacillus subterraneus TaxID=621109 RepID=A0A1H9I7A9_9BACI|nr:GNAT family N-acetyltransferase [Virgibacillus subterraneus]SEQ70449.1 Acetyltransferase (GNAT) family protein [Virgibacillus subterraneus]
MNLIKVFRSYDYQKLARLNEVVHNLHVKLYPRYFKPYNYSEMEVEFEKLTKNEKYTFLILSDKGENKGFIFFEILNKPSTPFKNPYKSLYVHQLSINESEQRKGYGQALMEKTQQIAHNEQVDCIELDYWIKNEFARQFYQKNNFVLERVFVRKNI